MTDAQGLAVFKCFFEYMQEMWKLSEGREPQPGGAAAALDMRPYVEPVIDYMLNEAKQQGIADFKEKAVAFAGSKPTIATADLLKFLAGTEFDAPPDRSDLFGASWMGMWHEHLSLCPACDKGNKPMCPRAEEIAKHLPSPPPFGK